MALIIILRNVSSLASVSDYEYRVQINEHVIERGDVLGHTRADGWHKLVEKLLEQRRLQLWDRES